MTGRRIDRQEAHRKGNVQCPVGVFGSLGCCMNRSNGGLKRVEPKRREACAFSDQLRSFANVILIPKRTILVFK